MYSELCLGTLLIEVICMKDVVWILCVKIAFGCVNDQNGAITKRWNV
jgi:dethiobiotin synthetase